MNTKKKNKYLDIIIIALASIIAIVILYIVFDNYHKELVFQVKVNNIEVINGNVEDYIDKFKNIDLIIIDPPRSGLDKKTREYLKRINSKYIIYVSCDMQTLKRDLIDLNENYKIDNINLVDMFRGTYHCESICLLERK